MNFFEVILYISIVILCISILFVFIRLAIGPSISDRIVAMDLLLSIAIAFIIIYSFLNKQTQFIDVAVILSLISFLGTIAVAYYILKGNKK